MTREQFHTVMVGIDAPMELEALLWDLYIAADPDTDDSAISQLVRIRALIERYVNEASQA